MNSIKNINKMVNFKFFDFVSQPANDLTFQFKSSLETYIGAVMTLLIWIIGVVLFFFFGGRDIINKTNPNLIPTTIAIR